MSSAMISRGFFVFITFSRSGTRFWIESILSSWISTRHFSSVAFISSGSVTKFGERYPRSNCMPSTTSTLVSRPLPSSTVITPSLPTLSNASAMILPISGSLFAEIVATDWMSAFPPTGLLCFSMSATTVSTP